MESNAIAETAPCDISQTTNSKHQRVEPCQIQIPDFLGHDWQHDQKD